MAWVCVSVCSLRCWQNFKVLRHLTMPLNRDTGPLTGMFSKVSETKHKPELCGMLGAGSWSSTASGCASGPHALLPGLGGGEWERKEAQVQHCRVESRCLRSDLQQPSAFFAFYWPCSGPVKMDKLVSLVLVGWMGEQQVNEKKGAQEARGP